MPLKGLKNWVTKLSRQDMPVVGQVIRELSELAGRDDADINQLADVILHDPNLTSQVLRVANSVYYNYTTSPISTVSRAIVLIGFKGMRAICISALVIENFLKKGPRERLLQMMAQAFHAATQARSLMVELKDDRAEEVFIAALLYHLGEMAFWASDTQNEPNAALLDDDPSVRKDAMDEILGTSFKAITLELAKQWRLGETLEKALYPDRTSDPAITAVLLGEQLSRVALKGWDTPAANDLLDQIAAFTNQDRAQTRVMVQESAEKTVVIARTYGADILCPLIPCAQSDAALASQKASSEISPSSGEAPASTSLASATGNSPSTADVQSTSQSVPPTLTGFVEDAQLQLNILRDLSIAAMDKVDVNMVMQMVAEGMHRGIGLPRVTVAFIRKGRLQAKYVLGEGTEHWREKFNFDVGPGCDNLFVSAFDEQSTFWVTTDDLKRHPEWHTPLVREVLGRHEAFVGLLQLGGQRVGVFYADALGLRPLMPHQYDSFRHFVSQAQMNLTLLSQQKKSKSS